MPLMQLPKNTTERSHLPLVLPFSTFHSTNTQPSLSLILRARLLTRLQLLQVPTANLHVARVLIHALCEVPRVNVARLGAILVLRLGRLRRVLLRLRLLLLGRRGRTATAAEEPANGVADGGTDCYTAKIPCKKIWRQLGNVSLNSVCVGDVRGGNLRSRAGHLSE